MDPMPHITIEYSINVEEHHDIDALVSAAHKAALDHGLASPTALRTRAVARTHFRAMTGEPHFAFVAITCRVGPGRTQDEKSSFIEAILDAAVATLGQTPLAIAWSIELTELDPALRINRNYVREAMQDTSSKDS